MRRPSYLLHQYAFLLQIIKQLSADKPIKFDQINMPGRTAKSLSHAWAKIKTEVAAAGEGDGGTPATPVKRTPATKRKAKGEAGNVLPSNSCYQIRPLLKQHLAEGDEAGAMTPTKKPKAAPKTPRKTPAKKAMKKSTAVVSEEGPDVEDGDASAEDKSDSKAEADEEAL